MVSLIGKLFNAGRNSFVLNKQSTVLYHGTASLTSKHLFIAATRVSSAGLQKKKIVFSPKPPSVPKLERVHFSAYASPNCNPAAVTSFSCDL